MMDAAWRIGWILKREDGCRTDWKQVSMDQDMRFMD